MLISSTSALLALQYDMCVRMNPLTPTRSLTIAATSDKRSADTLYTPQRRWPSHRGKHGGARPTATRTVHTGSHAPRRSPQVGHIHTCMIILIKVTVRELGPCDAVRQRFVGIARYSNNIKTNEESVRVRGTFESPLAAMVRAHVSVISLRDQRRTCM